MSVVSFITCETYDRDQVLQAVGRAIGLLGGMERFVKPGDRVLLKPNLLSAHSPEKHITTHPEVVRAVGRLVLDAGGKPFIGDSPALDPFRKVAEKTGMAAIARELGIEAVSLDNPRAVAPPPGATFRKIEIASPAVEADVVINLPKLKTHTQMLLTLGVKNLFGTVVGHQKGEWHFKAGADRDIFASLLLDIYLAVKPAVTLIDGVWGMEGNGPSNGRPRRLGLIAAAEDAVALDVSICQILGVPLRSFAFYRAAREKGIGEARLDRITFVGESPERFRLSDFQAPHLDAVEFFSGPLNRFSKRFLISKPVCNPNTCSGCGTCAEICRAGAVTIRDRTSSIDYDRCIRCFCCQEVCPENAISFHQGLLLTATNWLKQFLSG